MAVNGSSVMGVTANVLRIKKYRMRPPEVTTFEPVYQL